MSNIEQVMEVPPHKAAAVRSLTTHHETINVRWTRYAGHCWRSKDELISDVLLWTPSHGRTKAGQPAWTYIQQLCADMGCSPEDPPEAMDDKEGWRERVRDIHDNNEWILCINLDVVVHFNPRNIYAVSSIFIMKYLSLRIHHSWPNKFLILSCSLFITIKAN